MLCVVGYCTITKLQQETSTDYDEHKIILRNMLVPIDGMNKKVKYICLGLLKQTKTSISCRFSLQPMPERHPLRQHR